MAQLIQAIAAYGPKISLMEAADTQRFLELITQRTTLSNGVVKNVQESEVETLIGLLKEGRPVHTGIAIFTPSIDGQGNFSISVRVDKRITGALNIPGAFTGKVNNSENIGKSSAEIAAKWNEDHPDNLIGQEQPPLQAAPGLLAS
jgi:hypothetical protein